MSFPIYYYYSKALIDPRHPFSELHLLEYHHRMLDYVTNFQQVRAEHGGMEYFQPSTLRLFSPPDDTAGYGNKSVSDKIITEVFVDFVQRTREQETAEYLRSTTGKPKGSIVSKLVLICYHSDHIVI